MERKPLPHLSGTEGNPSEVTLSSGARLAGENGATVRGVRRCLGHAGGVGTKGKPRG